MIIIKTYAGYVQFYLELSDFIKEFIFSLIELRNKLLKKELEKNEFINLISNEVQIHISTLIDSLFSNERKYKQTEQIINFILFSGYQIRIHPLFTYFPLIERNEKGVIESE